MLAKIIVYMCVGQLIAVLLYMLHWMIRGLIKGYQLIVNEIFRTKVATQDIILFRRNKEAFMEWKREREQHE